MRPCIVVIDDDVDTVDCLRMALEWQSFLVVGAFSGKVGLELVRQHDPSLVLVDVMMPNLNGLEVCRCLRADPATCAIPIVVLSARSSLADQTAAFEAGADHYLTKPVTLEKLTRLVNDILERPALAGISGAQEVKDENLNRRR
ncbi:MAG TPA: response regulator [Anaerolineae bacterium]|nr:response regulator [Anaerolineae bacterium]